MKKLKTCISVFLCVLLFMTGCKKDTIQKDSSSDKHMIGIVFNDTWDVFSQAVLDYADYLEENFDVEIEIANFSNAGYSPVAMVNYLCELGVDVILNTYPSSIPESLALCEEYGIYLLQVSDFPTDTDIIEKFESSPNYLGYIKSDASGMAETMAENMLNAGYESIGLVSMSDIMAFSAFHNVYIESLQNTILEKNSSALAYTLRLPYFSIEAGLANLSEQGYKFDGMIASINTFFYSIDELKQLYGNDDLKVSYFGLSDNTREEFLSGDVLMVAAGEHNVIGLAFAYAYHYITSTYHPNEKLEIQTNYIPLYSVEDYDAYIETCIEVMPYSADELNVIIESLDKDNELLHTYAKNYSLEDLIKRNK